MNNSHKEGSFREMVTEVAFVAYNGKQGYKCFFDATPEQCCNFIWKNICATAVIIYINEYKIAQEGYKPIYGFKRTQEDTKNNFTKL